MEALADGHEDTAVLGEIVALAEGHGEAAPLCELEALVEGHDEPTPLSEVEALVEGQCDDTPLTELEGLQIALPEGLRLLHALAQAVPLPPLAELLGLLEPVGAFSDPDVAADGDALPQRVPLPVGEPQLEANGEAVDAADWVGAVAVAPALAVSAGEAVLTTLPLAHALAEPERAAVALAAVLPVEMGDVDTVAEGEGAALLLAAPDTEAAGDGEPPPLRRGPGEPDELALSEASAAVGEGGAEGERLTLEDGEREGAPEALPLTDSEAVVLPLSLLVALREKEAHAEELALAQGEEALLGL